MGKSANYFHRRLVLSDGTQDLPVSSFASGLLPAGQCSTKQVQVQVAAPHEGSWFLGAVADPAQSAPELIETNNALLGRALGIGSSPDFIIQAVSAPASAQAEETFPVSVTVCNQGTTGGATDVQLEALSSDGEGIPRLSLGFFYADWLEAGQCATQQVDGWIPFEGVWSLHAVADTWEVHSEFSETNNSRESALVSIGSAPDYVIQAVNAPASSALWGAFTASVTVCNQGTADGSTNVQLVVSRDADIRFSPWGSSGSQDQPVASFATGLLGVGQCSTQQVSVPAQWLDQGLWYLGAVADPSHSESELIETNNARAGSAMATGVSQDYFIQEVSGPANVQAGEPFTASVTVCNQGNNGSFSGTDVQVVLSEDTDIRFSNSGLPYHQDLPLQSFSTGSLMEGECMTQELQLSVQPPLGGSWHLGAVVDPGDSTSELIETNNSRASGDISVAL